MLFGRIVLGLIDRTIRSFLRLIISSDAYSSNQGDRYPFRTIRLPELRLAMLQTVQNSMNVISYRLNIVRILASRHCALH